MKLATIAILLLLACISSAGAADEQEQSLKFVWHSSHKCPPPADPKADGAMPEHPIAGDEFESAIIDELSYDDKGNRSARFSCKWIRISGFFVPFHYYHYRGRLFESAAVHYGAQYRTRKYIVENFMDPAIHRSAVGHRRVTLVARFYNLCASAPHGEGVFVMGGPCHYGYDNGMMLADAIVEKISDATPQYLLGEQNRPVLNLMPQVAEPDRSAIIERVRAWAALVQRGADAYAADAVKSHPYFAENEEARRELHDDITSPDSYFSYLNSLAAFRRLDTAHAPVEVFWNAIDPEPHYQAYGCICLKETCTNAWPLVGSDAEDFYGDAACTPLSRSETGWGWH